MPRLQRSHLQKEVKREREREREKRREREINHYDYAKPDQTVLFKKEGKINLALLAQWWWSDFAWSRLQRSLKRKRGRKRARERKKGKYLLLRLETERFPGLLLRPQ